MISFYVPGQPQGKGRARSTKSGHHYTPEKTRNYENAIGLIAKSAMNNKEPFNKYVRVEIIAFYVIPKNWPIKKKDKAFLGEIRPTTKPDLDNIAKVVLDAMNKIVYNDDSQVVGLVVIKKYDIFPAIYVKVSEI